MKEAQALKTDQISVITDALAQVWDGEQHLACGAVIDATMGYGKTYLIAALCRAYRGSGIVVTTKSATVVRRLVNGLTELLQDDGITVGIRQGARHKPGDVTVCTNAGSTASRPKPSAASSTTRSTTPPPASKSRPSPSSTTP